MLPSWLTSLLNNPLVSARIKAGITSASIAAGAWTLSHMDDWLHAHAAYFSHATDLEIAGTVATCVAGLIASVIGILYPQKDVTNVDAKIKTAAVTGSAEAANDKTIVSQVKDASGSAEALAALEAKLKSGQV